MELLRLNFRSTREKQSARPTLIAKVRGKKGIEKVEIIQVPRTNNILRKKKQRRNDKKNRVRMELI